MAEKNTLTEQKPPEQYYTPDGYLITPMLDGYQLRGSVTRQGPGAKLIVEMIRPDGATAWQLSKDIDL